MLKTGPNKLFKTEFDNFFRFRLQRTENGRFASLKLKIYQNRSKKGI